MGTGAGRGGPDTSTDSTLAAVLSSPGAGRERESAGGWAGEKRAARRQAARTEHLENAARLYEAKQLVSASAIMNEAGVMIGSSLIVDFPDRATAEPARAQELAALWETWNAEQIAPRWR
jgi:uncharacterized protein YciI